MTPVYFFYTQEDYLLDQAVGELLAALAGPEVELETVFLDADELSALALGEALLGGSLVCSRRAVVIKKPYWLSAGGRKAKSAGAAEAVLEAYLADPPAGQFLILTAHEKTAGNRLVKLLESHPAASVSELPPWPPARLKQWIRGRLESGGKRVEEDALQQIAGSGQDMYYIKNLLDKLTLLPEDTVDTALLKPHLDDTDQIKVFKLLDGVLGRKLPEAMAAFRQLLHQGEAPGYIFFMLFRQIYLYGWVKALHEERRSQGEIEKATGQKAFTVKNLLRYVRRFSWAELERFLEELLRTDIDMKSTGKDAVTQIECLLAGWAPAKQRSPRQ
jgi:DNA polymerase-3 subunit delta